MNDYVIVRFDDMMVDILIQLAPEVYDPYVMTDDRNKRILYARLIKALYGCMISGFLFWKNFSEKLKRSGFIINPYNHCVANIVINGKQCTIVWYIDYL